MGLKRKDFEARAVKRRSLSWNQVAAKERLRLGVQREIAEADEWARRNPIPKLPPSGKIRIEIPGLPAKVISVRRWPDGKILAGNRETTAKALGRKIGMLLDQFM